MRPEQLKGDARAAYVRGMFAQIARRYLIPSFVAGL